MKKILSFFLALSFGLLSVSAQNKDPEFVKYMNSPWVDSVYKSMTLKQQIGQMIFVELRPSNPSTVVKAMQDVKDLNVGGAVLFLSKLPDQAATINGLPKHRQNTSADSHRRRVGTRHAPSGCGQLPVPDGAGKPEGQLTDI